MIPELSHASRALLELPPPFRGKPYIGVIALALALRVQAVEDAANAVVQAFQLDTAAGDALAKIGAYVGQANLGWTDDVYRTIVKARIRINLSNGTRDDILEVIRYFTASTPRLEQQGPAGLRLTLDADGIETAIFRIAMKDARGHAIGMTWVHDGTMVWAGVGDSATDVNIWGGTDGSGPTLSGVETL